MKHNKRLVPKRRFKEFENTNDWEQRSFFDNIKSTIDFRGRTPKKLGLDWSKTGYLALSALNVKNGYIDTSVDAHYGNQELYDKWMVGRELKKGQVLFTTEAPMGNVARVPDDYGYILSQRTISFDVNPQKITEDFLAVLLSSPNTFNELAALSSGGTAKGVSQKSISKLKVIVPENLEEQATIGNFFKDLNNLIFLQERKLEKIKNLKLAYLSDMFPKEGEKYPKIRFEGFTDDWEESRLGDSLHLLKDGTHGTHNNVDKGVYLLSAKNIKNGKVIIDADTDRMISEKEYKKIHKNFQLKKGDVLLTVVGSIGESAIIENPENITFQRSVAYLRPNEKITSQFLLTTINTIKFQLELKSRQVVSAQPGIYLGVLDIIPFLYPAMKEQIKIGMFFKNLDNLILLNERKLEKLKDTKKAYLNEMFV